MANLQETIDSLAASLEKKEQTLDDALFALQTWFDNNASGISEAERETFSKVLNAEKETPTKRGKPESDDNSLIISVLRLHSMRLLYRYDENKRRPATSQDTTPYGRAKQRLQTALRQTEMALSEARVDAAIANAHSILNDPSANRRWLQDAFTRLQTVAGKDLIKLADSIPVPEPRQLNLFQRFILNLSGVTQDDIARRNLSSLRQIAELETSQLVEMIKLLAESFDTAGDKVSGQQALALLAKLNTD